MTIFESRRPIRCNAVKIVNYYHFAVAELTISTLEIESDLNLACLQPRCIVFGKVLPCNFHIAFVHYNTVKWLNIKSKWETRL